MPRLLQDIVLRIIIELTMLFQKDHCSLRRDPKSCGNMYVSNVFTLWQPFDDSHHPFIKKL